MKRKRRKGALLGIEISDGLQFHDVSNSTHKGKWNSMYIHAHVEANLNRVGIG